MLDFSQRASRPSRRGRDGGFIMVALLVGMAVAAVWLGAAIPAWRQQALREKEIELIFRGEQYARAIVLYQKKNQGLYPPSIDTLVSDRYLRKKWKDPVTGKDFLPVTIGAPQGGAQGGRGGGATNAVGGVVGVRGVSQATSIKIYKQQQQHSLWPFDAAQLYQKMGYSPGRGGNPAGGPGRGGPGRGGRDGGPGAGGPGRGGPDGGNRPGGPPPGPPRGGGGPVRPGGPGGAGS